MGMSSFDWSAFFNVALSLITFGAVGNIVFHKYRKKSEKMKPQQEGVDIADKAMAYAGEAMDEVGKWHDKVNELYDKSGEMKREISELKYQVEENNRKVLGMQKMLDGEIGMRRYAEGNICLREQCVIRIPEKGTYKKES